MRKSFLTVAICAVLGFAAACDAQQQPQRRGNFGGFGTPPGPPAPVPAQVAIDRPTAEQLATINAEIQKFVETNTSENKDLLKRYASMLEVKPLRDNPCIRPTAGGVRGPRHDAFVETAKNGDFDILFYGDSITDWWAMESPRGGKAVFDKYFGSEKVANFGVAGDTTQGLLWGMQNGECQGHKPKAIMLMIGTNSAFSESGAEIAEGVGACILELRKNFPDAKILLLAIFPRGANAQDKGRITNEKANELIAKLEDKEHVFFMNINDKFLKPDGSLIGFSQDNLHPNEEGYEIWAKAVADTLKSWK